MLSLKDYQLLWETAQPFPHLVLDNVLEPRLADELAAQMPRNDEFPWKVFDNYFEGKMASGGDDSILYMPAAIRAVLLSFNSVPFVSWLSEVAGIPDLSPDPSFVGGGIHSIPSGGKLAIHTDFNIHPVSKQYRRLNALLYLNKNWQEEWGGDIQFWNKDMTQAVKSISPVHNRMVIFAISDVSWHGHPEPLKCPSHRRRISMAWYYYSQHPSTNQSASPHSTIFQSRPGETIPADAEKYRNKVAYGIE